MKPDQSSSDSSPRTGRRRRVRTHTPGSGTLSQSPWGQPQYADAPTEPLDAEGVERVEKATRPNRVSAGSALAGYWDNVAPQMQMRRCITTSPSGENGFGYDPVFWVPEENCTAAELSPTRKNILSHRARALRLLVDRLKESVGDF